MKIATDKKMHFVVCAVIAAGIAVAMSVVSDRPLPCVMAGFMGAVGCGLGKEYGDSQAPGNSWSFGDIIADVAGAAVGCLAGFAALL